MYGLAFLFDLFIDLFVRFIGLLIVAIGVAQGLALSGILDPTPFSGYIGGLMPSVLASVGTYLVLKGTNTMSKLKK